MSEQIMWAVREPDDGRLLGIHEHRAHSIRCFLSDQTTCMDDLEAYFARHFEQYGYKLVQVSVRITEVPSA